MRRAALALLAFMILALGSAAPPARATIKNNEAVITGKVLYAMCTNDDADIARRCTTFIRGFVDGARTAEEMTSAKPFFCLPDSAGTDLVVLAFTREVQRLPRSSMDDTAANVLRNALWLAFPCSRR
ncbi:MAG TPA: Rap1a/Tai family immunity protein [Stellaceae bacterium]|nr:Rap1a/Tai family immunity protein [Stellaceae bacterium]